MRRKAFTLLEVLTVIGIIAILVTLVTLGVGHIITVGREKTTRVAMDNLKNLVAEKELHGGLGPLNAIFKPPTWNAPNPVDQVKAPGDVRIDQPDRTPMITQQGNGGPFVAQNAAGATRLVMNLLKSVPNNAKMLGGLPANVTWNPQTSDGINAPLMLDGWGNPIIYVPPGNPTANPPTGGLTNVFSDAGGQPPIRSPDNRGFWASAGPDGVFGGYYDKNGNSQYDQGVDSAYGDDNVYSFQN